MNQRIGDVSRLAGINTLALVPAIDSSNPTRMFSDREMLVSACAYDISRHPLRISAEVPQGTYWSISFYDMNTDNYRVINDTQATAGAVLLVLVKAGSLGPAPAGAEIVTSPTDRGIVLLRTLINQDSRRPELDASRREAKCQSLS